MPDDRESEGLTRRELLVSGAATVALACAGAPARREDAASRLPGEPMDIVLVVNDERRALRIDPRSTLLDVLRENLALTGTKKGCDMGQCGACTVLADGVRIDSCLALAAQYDGRSITTIEGLSKGGALHAVQEAFLQEDAFQCGYCTPGQILSCIGLLREGGGASDAEIREGMSGNICRCGAYPNIVAAVRSVRGRI
jgi:xanthine dehydrogenase YagT iron-sulfur-binding subunit